jgi:hypothetical protein
MSLSLAVEISEYMKATLSPPRSEPANSQAFLLRATPRGARSAAFLLSKLDTSKNLCVQTGMMIH